MRYIILLMLLAVPFVMSAASLALFNSNVLIFTTYGTSMLPLIHPDSVVYCVKLREYNVGDMVVYLNPWTNETILHRIVYKHSGFFVMKGDNLDKYDVGVMTAKDIICKVTKINKLLTNGLYISPTTLMFLLVFIIILLYVESKMGARYYRK